MVSTATYCRKLMIGLLLAFAQLTFTKSTLLGFRDYAISIYIFLTVIFKLKQ